MVGQKSPASALPSSTPGSRHQHVRRQAAGSPLQLQWDGVGSEAAASSWLSPARKRIKEHKSLQPLGLCMPFLHGQMPSGTCCLTSKVQNGLKWPLKRFICSVIRFGAPRSLLSGRSARAIVGAPIQLVTGPHHATRQLFTTLIPGQQLPTEPFKATTCLEAQGRWWRPKR